MKYIKESAIIFGITMIGEFLNRLLPLPVPAGVYGLFLLLLLLCTKVLKLEAIEATGNFLLDTMPIMFIPASVGLIDSYDSPDRNLSDFYGCGHGCDRQGNGVYGEASEKE